MYTTFRGTKKSILYMKNYYWFELQFDVSVFMTSNF